MATNSSNGSVNMTDTENSDCGLDFAFVLSFLIGGVVFLCGMVGNILAILILRKDKTATGFLLISLACADITILITLYIMKGIPALCAFANIYSFFEVYPYLLIYGWPMASVTHSAGCWITVLVTAHRYIAVCLPYKSASLVSLRKVRLYVLIAVLFSIFFNLPTFLDNYLIQEIGQDGQTQLMRVYTSLGKSKTYQLVYKTILFYVLFYIVPLVLLIILTVRLSVSLREASKRRAQMTNKEVSSRETTVMLVVVVIVFLCCQTLVPFRRVLEAALDRHLLSCPHFYFYYAEINVVLVMINSACNFLIYYIFGKRFRQSLVRLFKGCCKSNKVGPDGESNIFHTTNTLSGPTGHEVVVE